LFFLAKRTKKTLGLAKSDLVKVGLVKVIKKKLDW